VEAFEGKSIVSVLQISFPQSGKKLPPRLYDTYPMVVGRICVDVTNILHALFQQQENNNEKTPTCTLVVK
jgi:hypothetical protein